MRKVICKSIVFTVSFVHIFLPSTSSNEHSEYRHGTHGPRDWNVPSRSLPAPYVGLLERGLTTCGWDHAVVMAQASPGHTFGSRVRAQLDRMQVPVSVYSMDQEAAGEVVYHEYVVQRHTNFILIFDDNFDVLRQVNSLFSNFSRSVMAALPHHAQWLLLSNDTVSYPGWVTRHCDLDHVTSVQLHGEEMVRMETLMWGPGRRRRVQPVDDREMGERCSIFPNKAFGFNGRSLLFINAAGQDMLNMVNESNGRVQYSGYLMQLNHILQANLNFSSTILPPPEKMSTVTLADLENFLHNHSADMCLALYSQASARLKRFPSVFPVIFDTIIAAYVTDRSWFPSDRLFRGQDTDSILLLILGTLLTFVLLYRCFSLLQSKTKCGIDSENRATEEECENHRIGSDILSKEFKPNKKCAGLDGCLMTQNETGILRHIYHLVGQLDLVNIFGSLLTQDTVRRPKPFSLRVLIFSWCLFATLAGTILTATLTATFIKPPTNPPYTSVLGILQAEEVECGTFYETEILQKSKSWIINGQKWTGHLRRFPIYLNSTALEFRRFMEQPSPKRKMFIYYKERIFYQKIRAGFDNLEIIDDDFQLANLGTVTPPDSELVGPLSSAVVQLHASGMLAKIARQRSAFEEQTAETSNPLRGSRQLSEFGRVFRWMAVPLTLAFLSLGVELCLRNTVWGSLCATRRPLAS